MGDEVLRQVRVRVEKNLKKNGLKSIASATLASIFLSVGAPMSVAQNANVVALDGIIVSGEKLERSYLDTHTSVGVATEEDIENYNVRELSDAFNLMANVRRLSSNGGNNGFQIRGINADGVTQPASAPPVISVIIDGVTQSKEGLLRGSRATWDMKQIEVLRGPQSTLQGRNALAGAVIIESNDPTYTPEIKVKAAYGNLEFRNAALAVSGPIIQNQLAFRISGEFHDHEKDISFANPVDTKLGEDKFRNVRGKILIEPNAIKGLRVLLTASNTYDKPASSSATGPDYFARQFSQPSPSVEFREMRVTNYVSNASYAFNDWLKIRSISAINITDLDINGSPTAEAANLLARKTNRADDDFTQDLRLEIKKNKSGLSGVIGVFYGNFEQNIDNFLRGNPVLQGGPNIGLIDVLIGPSRNSTETKAVYADLRYNFWHKWSLIGGARYQQDLVTNYANTTAHFLAGGDTFYDYSAEFNVFLPKFGLSYEIDSTQTIAATAKRGYRQGFTENIVGVNIINTVDPEFVWTYELSYRKKSADNRFTIGTNIFYNEYKDHQVTVENPNFAPLTNTFNVANSISYGAEIEGRYNFGNGLQVFGALGLLKTEFKEFNDPVCAPSGGSCAGNEYPEAPSVTFSFGGIYKHHSGLFASANANYTGDHYIQGDINNQSQFKIKNRFIANTKFGYQYKNLTASIFVNNVFDEQYITSYSSDLSSASLGDGRTVGAELSWKFN